MIWELRRQSYRDCFVNSLLRNRTTILMFYGLVDLRVSQDLCFEHTFHGIKKKAPRMRNCSQKISLGELAWRSRLSRESRWSGIMKCYSDLPFTPGVRMTWVSQASHAIPCHSLWLHVIPCYSRLFLVAPQVILYKSILFQAIHWYSILLQCIPCDCMLFHAIPCYPTLCHVILHESALF